MKPVFVKNPQEIWRGIRLRYEVDQDELARAEKQMVDMIARVHAGKDGNKASPGNA
jgi:hypothetical protein